MGNGNGPMVQILIINTGAKEGLIFGLDLWTIIAALFGLTTALMERGMIPFVMRILLVRYANKEKVD